MKPRINMEYYNAHNERVKKLLQPFFEVRRTSIGTQRNYVSNTLLLERVIGKTMNEMLTIAKSENSLNWNDTQLKQWLTIFRNYCYDTYKEGTVKTRMMQTKAVFKHHQIYIGPLEYVSTKQVRKSEEIDYEDLPNREVLKKCINLKNPLLKAMTLFMSSTGLNKIDTWNLTIQDYLNATYEYHETNDIQLAIKLMDKSEVSIVPTFKLRRVKTGETYRTFASPESVSAINLYLLTRLDPKPSDRLFDVSYRHINDMFSNANDILNLGSVNGIRRFTPVMLRKYHATQLAEAGMNDSHIDLLQGRKPQSIARKSYIRVKRSKLKEEYIRCLPYLVVDDFEEVKTELDVVKTELQHKTDEYNELQSSIEDIYSELNDIRKRQDIWDKI